MNSLGCRFEAEFNIVHKPEDSTPKLRPQITRSGGNNSRPRFRLDERYKAVQGVGFATGEGEGIDLVGRIRVLAANAIGRRRAGEKASALDAEDGWLAHTASNQSGQQPQEEDGGPNA